MILTVTLNAAIDKALLIPRFRTGHVNRPAQVVVQAGGKGINVARVLRTLGEPVMATGVLAGHTGAAIEACLVNEGIPQLFHRLSTGESRTCLAVLHPETGEATEINEQGPHTGPEEFAAFLAMYLELLPQAGWVALSGSMPPGLGGEACLTLMELARQAGKPVSLDTSGPALVMGMMGGPDIVKPNQQEAEELVGYAITPDTLSRALGDLLARGARMVALTLGAAGAAVATRDEAWFYRAPSVSVVNPVGSGDSFLAGLLTGLQRGRSLMEAGALGVACGTANAAVAGAAACSLSGIEALNPLVHIAPLAEAAWADGATAGGSS